MAGETGNECVLGVLASGSGSNFRAIDNAIRNNWLQHARVGVVVSDKEDAGALMIARARGIPAFFLGDVSNDQRNETIADIFQSHEVGLGVAAGYLKLIGGAVLNAYPDAILNIHPAPLYRFGGKGIYGPFAHEAVLAARVRWSGPTVNLVDEIYDHGQILAHRQVPVLDGDTPTTLASRVLKAEHDLYWRVIAQQIARGRHPEV